MKNSICAGIVLFNPDLKRLKLNIDALVKQVTFVYLQDNGSANIADVEKSLKSYKNVSLLKSNNNMGIAWALNRLCEKSILDGYEWILTLDQDSICPENMIREYSMKLSQANMICPLIVDKNYGMFEKTNKENEFVKSCITSGCLLSLESWKAINGFDETMFIDGVDFEFCYRLRAAGMKILRVNNVMLLHEIGNITIRHFLWFKVIVKNHNSFRKFYIARNIIYMAKKRKKISPFFKAFFQEIKLLMVTFLYEKEKNEKISSIFKGIKAGLRYSRKENKL